MCKSDGRSILKISTLRNCRLCGCECPGALAKQRAVRASWLYVTSPRGDVTESDSVTTSLQLAMVSHWELAFAKRLFLSQRGLYAATWPRAPLLSAPRAPPTSPPYYARLSSCQCHTRAMTVTLANLPALGLLGLPHNLDA